MNCNLDLLQLFLTHASYDSVSCPCCGAKNSFIKHSSYERNFLFLEEDHVVSTKVTISRVQCNSCSHTHALLPMPIIPYSPFGFFFTISLLYAYITHHYDTIESLCQTYDISVSSLYRILHRLETDQKRMLGLLKAVTQSLHEFLCDFLPNRFSLACLMKLEEFSKDTGASFLQPRCNLRQIKQGLSPPKKPPT